LRENNVHWVVFLLPGYYLTRLEEACDLGLTMGLKKYDQGKLVLFDQRARKGEAQQRPRGEPQLLIQH
jgi:hypothetical protein